MLSSFPMIAASCENKNPTDESIVNNTTPQTQDNQIKRKKEQAKILMVLVIHLRILPHKLKVIKTQQKHKSTEIVSIKTDPTNSKTIHQQQENPTRFKVGSFYGMLPHKLKIKNKKKTVVVLVIHLRILPHKLKVIKTQEKPKSTDIVSLKTAPTNSKTNHQKQENPTRFKVVSFYGMLPHKLKIKNKKKTVVVLVIHLRILPHKLKIFKSKKIRIKEKEKDNPKDLLKQLDEIKQEYEKAKKIMKN
nr:hypothetical protein [Mycoplasmopsis bovis]